MTNPHAALTRAHHLPRLAGLPTTNPHAALTRAHHLPQPPAQTIRHWQDTR